MTNVNHNPTNDFPIGRLGIDDADDTEGHGKHSLLSEDDESKKLEEADTEGHRRHSHLAEDDEFHSRLEEADTEGHIKQ
jgi:hypothetical protein